MTADHRRGWSETHFGPLLAGIVALGSAVRLVYVLTDQRAQIGGDAFDYHLSALRLADGLAYTNPIGQAGGPSAHHPPGWVTVLGAVSWLGARSPRDHQLVGVAIGLGVVALAALVGRRYFNARVGLVAAVLAALYPGFWVLEGNILSEPLGLLVLGCLTLAVFSLREHPTLARSMLVGALGGLLALVRSEQIFFLPIVVAPLLLRAPTLSPRRRATLLCGGVVVLGAVLAPWTIYNAARFKDPVLLSTTDGPLLLIGNCPPYTYSGAFMGYFDIRCTYRVARGHPNLDASQLDPIDRKTAFDNVKAHLDRMPLVVPARFGRALAIFRPSQTVGLVADWMTTGRSPIWAWVVSYWLLLPLALAGAIRARRAGDYIFPLVGPLVIVVVNVAISYGEPRYHTPADLGVVVLAAVGIDSLAARLRRVSPPRIPSVA